MKYMLLIYAEEKVLDETKREACYKESMGVVQQLRDAGQFVSASPLQPVATATTVRMREGKRIITDGPFAETREQLGGYFLVDASDLDEAIAIASRIPGARFGTVEVRPVVELPGLHEEKREAAAVR